jgi:hypothetical protein
MPPSVQSPLLCVTAGGAHKWHDVRTFFVLMSRKRLKAALLAEGQALAAEVEGLVKELAPRLAS